MLHIGSTLLTCVAMCQEEEVEVVETEESLAAKSVLASMIIKKEVKEELHEEDDVQSGE